MSRSRRVLQEDVLQNTAFTQPPSRLPSLLQTLKRFITESLQDKVISTSQPLREVLRWAEVDDEYLGDLEWFIGSAARPSLDLDFSIGNKHHDELRGFPADVLVEEAVAVYEMLEAESTQ